ncbi:P-loop containing nucleoside triphosphate hydrolase protein [Hysterangium stoloniferum]|nr:P-loop containing nucleoside triphosphate hydrolase protein [Hysterangium stoloniferum]
MTDSLSIARPVNQRGPISSKGDSEQVVLILVGLVGSGKSTFAEALEAFFPNFRRCNQDDLGSRRKVEHAATRALENGFCVCVDRTNFDESQRRHFINIAHSSPNTTVWALVFDTPYEICASRLQLRTNHPTITTPELGLSVLARFSSEYCPPVAEEGFDRILSIKPHPTGLYTREEIASILDDIRRSPALQPSRPPPPSSSSSPGSLQFFRASGRSRGGLFRSGFRSASPPSGPANDMSRTGP